MKSAKSYVVRFERDEPGWHVFVPSIPGARTHAKTLEQGRERIREALSLFVDNAKSATLIEDVRLPRASKAVTAAQKTRALATAYSEQASKATAKAVAALADEGISLRDAASLLGLSYQRVGQLKRA